jgi:hypothetical protein
MAENNSKPIILDVGTKSRKRIRELKRGEGKLVDEVSLLFPLLHI